MKDLNSEDQKGGSNLKQKISTQPKVQNIQQLFNVTSQQQSSPVNQAFANSTRIPISTRPTALQSSLLPGSEINKDSSANKMFEPSLTQVDTENSTHFKSKNSKRGGGIFSGWQETIKDDAPNHIKQDVSLSASLSENLIYPNATSSAKVLSHKLEDNENKVSSNGSSSKFFTPSPSNSSYNAVQRKKANTLPTNGNFSKSNSNASPLNVPDKKSDTLVEKENLKKTIDNIMKNFRNKINFSSSTPRQTIEVQQHMMIISEAVSAKHALEQLRLKSNLSIDSFNYHINPKLGELNQYIETSTSASSNRLLKK